MYISNGSLRICCIVCTLIACLCPCFLQRQYFNSREKHLCLQVLANYADAIEYVGSTPYFLLEPILKRCTSQQLAAFESFNPVYFQIISVSWFCLSCIPGSHSLSLTQLVQLVSQLVWDNRVIIMLHFVAIAGRYSRALGRALQTNI